MLQVKSNLRSVCSNLGQFVSTQVNFILFLFLWETKKIFCTFDLLFILLLLFISILLSSPTIPSLLSQHPSPYSFYLNAYMTRMSLEPPTFGFPLDSCPDALPLSHGDLDASSTIFLITYTVVVIDFLKLFKSVILILLLHYSTCTSALTIYKLTVLKHQVNLCRKQIDLG